MVNSGLKINATLLHTIILALICLPYCINLGKSSIWDANEAFYAETPREMMVRGDYLAPHFNFQPRTQKPPLTYWIVLASYKLFGVDEFAVRFPSALAAIGTILFSYGMAAILFGRRAALFAAVITGITARIFILARRLPIDILLVFFLTGALFFLIRAIQRSDRRSWIFFYIFVSLGFLTKGPIAIFLPVGTYILWSLWAGKEKHPIRSFWQALLDTRPVLGALLFAGIVLPWYVLIYRAHGWLYISPFFLRDNFGRFAAESLGPSRSVLYYFSIFATDFFPWSLLGLPAVYYLWIHRKERLLKNTAFGLPALWCLLIFAFFSLSRNKQEYYIAPMYPGAALLLSGILDRIAGKSAFREELKGCAFWNWIYGTLAILLLLLASFMPYILSFFMPGITPVLDYGPSIVLLAGALSCLWSVLRGKQMGSFFAVASSLWAIYLTCALVYLPALETSRPVKDFCRTIESRFQSNDEAGYFGTALPSMAYYLRRPIFEESSSEQMMQKFQSGKRIFCVLSQKDFASFSDNKDLHLHILDRHARFSVHLNTVLNAGHHTGNELLLVSNRP